MPIIPGSSGGPTGPYPQGEGRYGIPEYAPREPEPIYYPPEPPPETKAETLQVDNREEAARLHSAEDFKIRHEGADTLAEGLEAFMKAWQNLDGSG